MSKTHNIDILLSTYNGEKYLEVLLDSLIKQNYSSWRLIVRDDGSIDQTMQILKKYAVKCPIILIEDQEKRLGASQSFAKLLSYSTADYIMFCDQDDVWLPMKIENSLQTMLQLEFQNGEMPLLVHSDLTVVDAKLDIISPSFSKYQNLNPNNNKISNLLVQNVITGCTMMINKQLKQMVLPIPSEAIMHDWWIALIVSAFGKIGYIELATIMYRQHYNNDTGAKHYNLKHFLSKLRKINEQYTSIIKIINQGEAFLARFNPILSYPNKEIVIQFTMIIKQSRSRRLMNYFKYDFKKNGKIRNIGFWLLLLALKKQT